jgi:uncharacterized phiE125 gp8 family phage protein
VLLPHAIAVTVPPSATPVSLAEVKEHLLVQHDLDDALLSVLLKAATGYVERAANVYLMPQTVEISFSELCGERVELPVWPIRAVSSVQYADADGDSQTWDSGDYQTWLAHRPPLLSPGYGETWPVTRAGLMRAAWVTCTVGHANAAAVPEEAKHPVRLIVAHNYANKGDGKDPTGEMGIPPAAKTFIEYLRQDFYR